MRAFEMMSPALLPCRIQPLAACGGEDGEAADYVFRGGRVWTGVEGEPAAGAVAVGDGRILAGGRLPLRIYSAVTRRTIDGESPAGRVPGQKISLEEAPVAYTRSAACAAFREDDLGTLEPGMYADPVVLSEDLFETDPAKIPEVDVDLTTVGGEIVHERDP